MPRPWPRLFRHNLHNFNFTANITFQAYTLYIPILFQPPLHVLTAHVFQPPSDADITIKPFLIWNGQIFSHTFQILYSHEACSFYFLLFPSGFIMAQNSVIFNCGGKYFHVNNTFGPIFTSFAAVILITPFTMAFPLDIRPVNSFHQTISHLSSDELSHVRTKKPTKI